MNILIIDDEKSIAEYIAAAISKKYADANLTIYTSARALLDDIDKTAVPDIVFTDIKIPEINGIELGTFLLSHFPLVKIIFVSGCPDCVSEIFFNIQPYGFLEKPVQDEKLYRYIDKIIADENDELSFCTKSGVFKIKANNVIYMESDRKIVSVFTTDGACRVTAKLNEIQPHIPGSFVRCHQSYIVNLKYVSAYNANTFTMPDGKAVPISRSCKEQAANKYYAFKGNLI